MSNSSSSTERRRFARELSWLAFNERVLEEAESDRHPLLERFKFIAIFSSNLEEFFQVRVAELLNLRQEGRNPFTMEPWTPDSLLATIRERVEELEDRQHRLLHGTLLPLLAIEGWRLPPPTGLPEPLLAHADALFENLLLPLLTPMGIDPCRPFPTLPTDTLILAVRLRRAERSLLAFVPLPSVAGRFHRLEGFLVPTEDLVRRNLSALFQGHEIEGAWPFYVGRDMDLDYEDIEGQPGEDLLETIKRELTRRRDAELVRLVHDPAFPPELLQSLGELSNIHADRVWPSPSGLLKLSDCMEILGLPGMHPALRDTSHEAQPLPLEESHSLLDRIRQEDILLHHPYDDFRAVVRFLEEAAADPDVLAIKQIIYRVSKDSAIVEALCRAAEAGKHVSVLVELKARFDEKRNIDWAERLERSGVHVVYGILGLKTHAKILLVVRREPTGIRRYLHLGTGNYNEGTARLYTDLSLLTCDEELAADAGQLLNVITGFSEPSEWNALAVAPTGLRPALLRRIERERETARGGGRGLVRAKMNALVDPRLIEAVEDAAADGVEFRFMVRGMCCLVPNARSGPGGIQVRSIVDRFLEHSRLFLFGDGSRTEAFLSSADWMPRNLDRRIEVLAPVRSAAARRRLLAIWDIFWAGNRNSRELQPDGRYLFRQLAPEEPQRRAQLELAAEARRHHRSLEKSWHPSSRRRRFESLT